MECIYLDNSSTTRPCREAVEAATRMMEETWGNPSSLHTLGLDAERAITAARRALADKLSCREEELIFTSGGTEANNLAIFGAAQAKKRVGSKIVTTAMEHPSVLNAVQQLAKEGFQAVYVQPDGEGHISPEQLANAIDKETILVTVMAVNNEVGTVFPLEAAAKAIKATGAPALLHVDAVQGFGKLPLNPTRLGVDLMTISAHKIHGPKGVGALYMKKGVRLLPRAYGGGQEKALRPGTEASPLIAAFGAAIQALPPLQQALEHAQALNDQLRCGLATMPGATVNSPKDALPFICNLSCGSVRAETMLHFLASKGVYVSSGSACAKGAKSHVMAAMKLPAQRINSALRVSFSRENTRADVDAFLTALEAGMRTLAAGTNPQAGG